MNQPNAIINTDSKIMNQRMREFGLHSSR
jgi:hypothetical protein